MRPRRPASPRLHYLRAEGPLDADEKRALASSAVLRRPYFPSQSPFVGVGEWRLLLGLTAVASLTRLYRLSQPDSVV